MFTRVPPILIERRTDRDGNLLHFVTRTSRRPWLRIFDPEDVPPFEGDRAWFEEHRERGGRVRLVGPVEAPAFSPTQRIGLAATRWRRRGDP